MRSGLFIGTSGWSYREDWRGIFYDPGAPMLAQYFLYFDTVEINSTFYGQPRRQFIDHLTHSVGPDKFFTVKMPRMVTHEGRLDVHGDASRHLEEFLALLHPLAPKVEAVLIQLPPWDIDQMADLEAFLSGLDRTFRYAIEFRHESWLVPKTWRLLEDYDIAYVVVDQPLLPVDLRVTTDFSYVRWHGHGARPWYDYRYSLEELSAWVPRLRQLQDEVPLLLGYFNNHFRGNAPLNALQMLNLLSSLEGRHAAKLQRMIRAASVVQMSLSDFERDAEESQY